MAHRLLIVDSDPTLRLDVAKRLRHAGYACESSRSARETRARIRRAPPDGMLLDVHLDDGCGLDLLSPIATAWPNTPVIVTTSNGSIGAAVRAMTAGASTYLQKPLNFDRLLATLRDVLTRSTLCDRRTRRHDRMCHSPPEIASRSASMKIALDQVAAVARSPASTALLIGESGTGKGLIARAIHCSSRRAPEPFLTVTCSAIPEQLLEAELFGHEQGAFTDAKAARKGVFEAADGGTVFLDEVGDMPPWLQAKLLGVLEDRSFRRIGGTETVDVDVRIVAATHRDLDRAVDEGRFRRDLLYRLRVVPIVVPPLRDRRADLEPLAEQFLERFNGEFGRSVRGLSRKALAHLAQHTWRGNVRELRNVIERAMIFARGDTLEVADLVFDTGYRPQSPATRRRSSTPHANETFRIPDAGMDLEAFKTRLVRQAMSRARGNKSRAAKLLRISRDQISYRLKTTEDSP